AEDGIRDPLVTGVQTCALPICRIGFVRTISWVSLPELPRFRKQFGRYTNAYFDSRNMFEDLKALLRGDVESIASALKTPTGRSRSEERRVGKESTWQWRQAKWV